MNRQLSWPIGPLTTRFLMASFILFVSDFTFIIYQKESCVCTGDHSIANISCARPCIHVLDCTRRRLVHTYGGRSTTVLDTRSCCWRHTFNRCCCCCCRHHPHGWRSRKSRKWNYFCEWRRRRTRTRRRKPEEDIHGKSLTRLLALTHSKERKPIEDGHPSGPTPHIHTQRPLSVKSPQYWNERKRR